MRTLFLMCPTCPVKHIKIIEQSGGTSDALSVLTKH